MRKLQVEELERLSIEEFKVSEKFPYIIILDNIRSLNNVGSFFRTADAFRASKMILGGYTPHPPHREITRSALGAELSVDWEKKEDLISYITAIKSEGYEVFAIEQASGSIMLQNFTPDYNKPCAFVFGNEVEGVSNDIIAVCDACLEIPQYGTKHSLNVAISAGIVLWEYVRKR